MSVSTIVIMVLLGLSAFVVLRILRGGLGSLEDSLKNMDSRIKKTEAGIREQALSMSREEQMHIMSVALRELLELPGCMPGTRLEENRDRSLCIIYPGGEIDINFSPRTAHLASVKGRTLHGRGIWLVNDAREGENFFDDMDMAVRYVRTLLGKKDTPTENANEGV